MVRLLFLLFSSFTLIVISDGYQSIHHDNLDHLDFLDQMSRVFKHENCINGVLLNMEQSQVPITIEKGAQFSIPSMMESLNGLNSENLMDAAKLLLASKINITNDFLANSQDTTQPMQSINELAQFNNIQPQYRLVSEEGLPHNKKFTVSLQLGDEEYFAEGTRIKFAQRAAAAKALRLTRYSSRTTLSSQTRSKGVDSIVPTEEWNALPPKQDFSSIYTQGAQKIGNMLKQLPAYMNMNSKKLNKKRRKNRRFADRIGKYSVNPYKDNVLGGLGDSEEGTCGESGDDYVFDTLNNKSPVSIMHEISAKYNIPVNFQLKSEYGPPHAKVFVTECSFAEYITEGEGKKKKISKTQAAENMLRVLKKLPSIREAIFQSIHKKTKNKSKQRKRKSRSLKKDKTEAILGSNPVSRFFQWVSSNEGMGSTKNIAKRAIAEAMLHNFDFGKTTSPSMSDSINDVNSNLGASTNHQPAPKLLLMQDKEINQGIHVNTPSKQGVNAKTTVTIAKELLKSGTSPTADALAKLDKKNLGTTSKTISSKDQLLRLGQVVGFEVQFSHFKKGDDGDLLSLVSISTEPPMICQGIDLSIEKSHEKSAREALERLAQMGLDGKLAFSEDEGIEVSDDEKSISGFMTYDINDEL